MEYKKHDKEYKEPENKKAVFNMAINTLQRLGDMLEEISKLTYETFLDQMTRQRMKVDLVKQFYVQATPLLPKDKIENYSKKILTLKPTTKQHFEKRSGNTPVFKGLNNVFDYKLDQQLDEILIELQLDMNLQGFVMPSFKDSRHSWGEGD